MHSPFSRTVKNADTAFLFIHGILGTPRHFDAFIDLLPENVSVYNMLLEGHGKGVKDFSAASMKSWKEQVSEKTEELLRDHSSIIIVAHSMGTLFAIEQAIKHPDRIKRLFFLACPLRIFPRPRLVSTSLKVHTHTYRAEDERAAAMAKAYGVTDDKLIFRYIGWVPRFLELFAEVRRTRRILGKLNVDCIAFQSAQDEMVSARAVRELEKNPCINVRILENSSHCYYGNGDFEGVLSEFKRVCITE